jgi:Phosphotransferase enzyme family
MRILVGPLDARFPQLVRASSPAVVPELVAELPAGSDGAVTPDVAAYEVSAIRYRPGQRHVLRYVPVDHAGRRRRRSALFAKLYQNGDGRSAANVARQIADWLGSAHVGVSAVRPLGYLPADDIVAYPLVVGKPLSGYALERAGEHLALAGVALGVLQRAPVELFDEVQPHSFEGEVRAIARASEHVGGLAPRLGARIDDVLARAKALHERLPNEQPRLAHGDYKADHAWVTSQGLTLIDFNTCSLADPALDVGKFLADVGWWFAGSGAKGLQWAQQRFLDGYGATEPSERMLRARLYEVLILTKITVRRVRLFDDAWESKTEALIATADDLLQRLERTAGAGASVEAPLGAPL